MNDYGLMWTESDTNKAPQDEQTDWLAGRARHFLPLKHYFLNFHFNHWQPHGMHPAWSMGGRSQAPSLPTVVSIEQPSLMPRCCGSPTAILFHTCVELYSIRVQLKSPIFHLIILLSLPWFRHPPFHKHLTIFKYKVIRTEFTSTLVVESSHSL